MTLVKICGLTSSETVDAAVAEGADYLGFVLFHRSPRALTPDQAGALIERTAGRARTVVLLVDPDDALVATTAALGPDLIQLHGRETPARVAEVRTAGGLPIIKALPVANADDLAAASACDADHLMFDAKPPTGTDRPGGHGAVFDWSLLDPRHATLDPLWFLAGGLTPENVAEAVRVTAAPVVDVSSGVESAPGVKDPALIAAFIRAVRQA